jgi:hypothetical protein
LLSSHIDQWHIIRLEGGHQCPLKERGSKIREAYAMPVVLEEAAAMLGIAVKELERQSLKAFLEKELRAIRMEILAICQKYGVSSWEEMNELIIEEAVEEGKILDDFQRVDHLTAKARRIQELLGRL